MFSPSGLPRFQESKGLRGQVNSGTPASSLLTGLVAYWKFEEASGNARADWTGRGNTLAEDGGAVARTTGVKSFATVLASGFLSRANTADVQLGNFDFTLAAWFQMASDHVARTCIFMGKFLFGGERGYRFQCVDDGTIRFIACANGTDYTEHNSDATYSNTAWNLAVVRYNATTDALRVYLNGVEKSFVWADGIFATPSIKFCVGADTDGAGNQSNHTQDESAIWTRYLTDQEVAAFYNGGLGTTPPF